LAKERLVENYFAQKWVIGLGSLLRLCRLPDRWEKSLCDGYIKMAADG